MKPLKILIVDDSALARRVLREILSAEPDFEVVGCAANSYLARRKIVELEPDVLTLDIEMPGMDGLTFLEKLMRLRPLPVVMVSKYTAANSDIAVRALQLGAVDCVEKPSLASGQNLSAIGEELVRKVRFAGSVNRMALSLPTVKRRKKISAIESVSAVKVIAIGASIGGPKAVSSVLSQLPPGCPPVVVVQHIGNFFTKSLVRRLDDHTELSVHLARRGMELLPGNVYVAPGDYHLTVKSDSGNLFCDLEEGERIKGHRPSVEVLFRSLLESCGDKSLAVLLTGMGDDGAEALLEIRKAGGITVAQDRDTSVVWGMPGKAVSLGAACYVWPLEEIGERLTKLILKPQGTST